MEQITRRYWKTYLGIWSLPLIATLPLSLLILERTFYIMMSPDRTGPDIYLNFVEADLMLAAILGFFVVAVAQSFLRGAHGAKRILVPHLCVWMLLGMAMTGVNIVKPAPPPLTTRLAGEVVEVPRVFRPVSTRRYIPRQDRSVPIFDFSVCRDTVEPPYGKGCYSTLVQVNEDPNIGTAFSALAAETAFAAYLEESGVTVGDELEEVIDEAGPRRVVRMARGSADANAWVTLTEGDVIERFASCGWRDGCLVAFESKYGHIAYRTSESASQTLAARDAHEAALLELIESWTR